MRPLLAVAVVGAIFGGACNTYSNLFSLPYDGGTPYPDASAPDARAWDASARDASAPDARAWDASARDASAWDDNPPDASAPDASARDASARDASAPDAG